MGERKYIDFKLYLTKAPVQEGAHQVALLPTPEVGETITPVTVCPEKDPSTELFPYLQNKQHITVRKLVELGKQLSDCLLPQGTIRDRFRYAYDRAGEEGKGVRLRLIIADHALKEWPWEYVYYEGPGQEEPMDGFLVLNDRISIVRHEPLPHPHPRFAGALADLTKVKMLVAAASPDVSELNLKPLEVDKEVGYITEAVEGFDLENVRIHAEPLPNVSREKLRNALLAKAEIFHFAGHGYIGRIRDDLKRDPAKEEVYLLLSEEGASKKVARLSGADLASWLRAAEVRLAILGACYSGRRNVRYPWDSMAGALVGGEIPAVIAMQYEVIDTHAVAFSRAFYSALGLGLSLDEAVWSGRSAMLEVISEGEESVVNAEWGVPVLYSRLADGALFPERMERATESAEVFRKVFRQTVTEAQKGNLIGVKVEFIQNGVRVVQKLKEVTGKVTGIEAGEAGAGANILVEQDIEVVDGLVIGGEFGVL